MSPARAQLLAAAERATARLPEGLADDLRDATKVLAPSPAGHADLRRLYGIRLDRWRRVGLPSCEGLPEFVAALDRVSGDGVSLASWQIGTVHWIALLDARASAVLAAIRSDVPWRPRPSPEVIARGEAGAIPPARAALLGDLAAEVAAVRAGGVARVAIDGVDGAGKTTFADELAAALEPHGRQVIRASVDDFHLPTARRYARGRDSPEGFFLDSYDYDTLRELLLAPLAPGGSRRFRRRAFDLRRDVPVVAPEDVADADAILLIDGIFLHRDELAGEWDHSIFLDVPFEVSTARCAARGDRLSDRYLEGQRIYLATCDPAGRATRVIDNSGASAH